MTYNFSNITFIIPVRFDSLIRLENLSVVFKILSKWKSEIIIVESGKYGNLFIKKMISRLRNVHYFFYQDRDSVFYRTHFINLMVEKCQTKLISVWDADVLVNPKQIKESQDALINNVADVSFPYNGDLLNVSPVIRENFILDPKLGYLEKHKDYMDLLYGRNAVGGGFILDRQKYIDSGKENESFYGWGPEDAERYARWVNLGMRIHRANGPMYHLYHPRDINGTYRSEFYYKFCQFNLLKTIYGDTGSH